MAMNGMPNDVIEIHYTPVLSLRKNLKYEGARAEKNVKFFFALEPSFLCYRMNKIKMSLAFHSHITRKNQSKMSK